MNWKKAVKFYHENRTPVICVTAGIILLVITVIYTYLINDDKIEYLKRGSYGQGDIIYDLTVEGIGNENGQMEILVQDRQYSQEEAEQVFEDIVESIGEIICGENENLSSVIYDLNLKTRIEDYGVRLRWMSDEPEILSPTGTVYNEGLEEKKDINLSLNMTDGLHSADYEIPVVVLPKTADKTGGILGELKRTITEAEESEREKEELKLPEEYGGMKLTYKSDRSSNYILIPLLVILTGFLLYAKKKQDIKDAVNNRNKKLILDYAEIVSKLRIFMGAGMTMRNSWERIVKDYEAGVDRGEKEKRPAYDEMQRALYQMQSGVAEGVAYREFGRRCAVRSYIKLSSLLEQNMRTGTKNLNSILSTEMTDAFEQRKNLARRMGEEAGTKLLLPLFMMLAIVMVIIIVPAMAAF